MACPAWMAPDYFSLHGSGELSSLILESEMHLWTTGIPHHCRCIVAGRLLLPNKTCEHGLRCRQFVTAGWSFGLQYGAHDEMGSLLALLE
jgi:hypothetical protein